MGETAKRLRSVLTLEWASNSGYPRSQVALACFRTCRFLLGTRLAPISKVLYRVVVEVILNIELPIETSVAPGLVIYHGQGLVVSRHAVIGEGVTLRHNVTIGNRGTGNSAPTIGAGVDVGASAIVLGGISIGEGASIGAGAVVLHDVPAGRTVVGNPARLIGGA